MNREYARKLREKIKFFDIDRPSDSNTVFYHLDEDRFYVRNPRKSSHEYAEISRWCDIPNSEGLWVKLVSGRRSVILHSKQLIGLVDNLKFLQSINNCCFDKEGK